jgi:hypothetical protein
MMSTLQETYLGDGLYVSMDGYMIRLRTSRPEGEHCVYLEPNIYQALVDYIERIGWARPKPRLHKPRRRK